MWINGLKVITGQLIWLWRSEGLRTAAICWFKVQSNKNALRQPRDGTNWTLKVRAHFGGMKVLALPTPSEFITSGEVADLAVGAVTWLTYPFLPLGPEGCLRKGCSGEIMASGRFAEWSWDRIFFSSVTHGQSRVALSDFSGLGRILTQVWMIQATFHETVCLQTFHCQLGLWVGNVPGALQGRMHGLLSGTVILTLSPCRWIAE